MSLKKQKKVKERKPERSGSAKDDLIRFLSDKARKYHALRRLVDDVILKQARQMEDLSREISRTKADLLNGMKIAEISEIPFRGGRYVFARSRSFSIKDPIALDRWARKNGFVKADQGLIREGLKIADEKNLLPPFAVKVETDSIIYRSEKRKDKKSHGKK
ncbi:MAG TPA: hypothetical protein PKG74_02210 [Candidatus Colwellbacteria bacterium]|nr:hypothetical protein [Candidatus Colwellbacteria bacterium]